MLKNTLTLSFLLVLLTGCVEEQVIRTQYVDRVVYEYPPESLLVIPSEPTLPSGDITNKELVDWSIDLRSAYREVVNQLKGIGSWQMEMKKPLQE